jgi:glycine cleavage system protein P-like pyridoxal-binding family
VIAEFLSRFHQLHPTCDSLSDPVLGFLYLLSQLEDFEFNISGYDQRSISIANDYIAKTNADIGD